jgi:hypothetical protein
MPYFTALSVAGSVVSLGDGGENKIATNAITYTISNDSLVGCDVLVISETLGATANVFSGRKTTSTANTNTSITLDEIGTVNTRDYRLVSPPGYYHYVYLGSFYVDTAEVRNIADSGGTVLTTGSSITEKDLDNDENGASSTGVQLSCAGHISPLATGLVLRISQTCSSASTGSIGITIGMNASHSYYSESYYKDVGDSRAFTTNQILATFLNGQSFYILGTGGLKSTSLVRLAQVRGWIEN